MKALLLLLLLSITISAQVRPTAGRIMGGSGVPGDLNGAGTGNCNSSTTLTDIYIRTGVAAASSVYLCNSNAWVLFSGSGGITNGAGNNVVPKSDGTNLITSQISDDGTDVSIATGGLNLAATGKVRFSLNEAAYLNTLGPTFFDGTTSRTWRLNVQNLTGTRTHTVPNANGTLALIDLAQTWSATQTFGAVVGTTWNGNTWATGTGTLSIGAGKTATVSNTLTFNGTDSSSVDFGTGGTVSYTIASGTSALGTSAISSGTCATAVTTTATGTATTDVVSWGFNTDVTGITGYAPVTTGALTIFANPITNNVVFRVCNLTSASITPGAVTLNWRVVR